jgi:hypothetical protein
LGARKIAVRFKKTDVGELIRAVAQEAPLRINTIRRYLALAEFVDRRVLPYSSLEPKEALHFVRTNFSGLETVSRIEKINPTRVSKLLTDLEKGEISTRYLEKQLEIERSANPTSTTARRGQAISSRLKELRGLEAALQAYLKAEHFEGKFVRISGPSFIRANWAYFGLRSDDRTGFLSPHATSEKGFEDAFIQASFSSRFFRSFYLILPAVEAQAVDLIKKLNSHSKAGIGVRLYANDKIESPLIHAEPHEPERVEIDCRTLYSHP